jgi:hypothetical protein
MQKKGIVALTLLLALALLGTTIGPAASADPVAQTAGLKKCLKKAKRIQDPVKRKKAKKRCKKKFGTLLAPNPVPLVRATLTWDSDPAGLPQPIDLDLWVFDTNGNKARAAANTIPSSTFSPNITRAPGTETFTDLIYKNPGGRDFSFGVCYQDGGSLHTNFQISYVTADGVTHTASGSYGADGASTTFPGGAPIPTQFCKAP